MKNNKIEPWRLVICIIAIIYIIFIWVKKNIVSVLEIVPKDEVVIVIITTILVSILKVGIFAFIFRFIKWLINKVNKK